LINVLLCDQNPKWLENFKVKLTEGMELVSAVDNGKSAQEVIVNNEINILIINVETKKYSFFEVVKFIKQNSPKTVVVMISENKKILEDYFYNDKEIEKLGIAESYIKPFPVYHLIKFIEQTFKHKQWGKVVANENEAGVEEEVKESDQSFTSLELKLFQQNNVVIFDLYIRLGKNKYIKIYNQGDKVDNSRIKKYKDKDPNLRLYFKTSDRLAYVNFSNELMRRVLEKKTVTSIEDVIKVDSSVRMFLEEVNTKGLPAPLVEESIVVCENIFKAVSRNPNLQEMMDQFFSVDDSEEAHSSLTAFYSAIICKHVDWVTSHSRDNIILGALLHDIGKVKYSKKFKSISKFEYSKKDLETAHNHPEYGMELLDNLIGLSEQVKQIVYQHHELNTGEGYPNGLTSSKIYPLAKIVAFANCVSRNSIHHKLSPLDTMRKLMTEKTEIMQYEPFVIKAFLKGFVSDV
jgi:putative nucleotidyltransferase with HDIG domain